MEPKYLTLQTIYEIVKAEPAPHTYPCSPREIILRQMVGWDIISTHLEQLAAEELIQIKQLGNTAVCITEAGIEKIRAIKENAVI